MGTPHPLDSPERPSDPVVVTDGVTADDALRLARGGTAMLWRGDYPQARQLLDAMARRVDRDRRDRPDADPDALFHRYRQAQARRARVLGLLLVDLDADGALALRRAPDVREACREAFGPGPHTVALRELVGAVAAHEWRRRGIPVAALDARIHPHHGVFAPTRTDYVDLVARAPLPPSGTAFDIGTGTGVLAAVLARRGVPRVVATDVNPAAVACARDNLARLGLDERVEVRQADLFPRGRATLIVANPPWLPATPTSPLEDGVYDRGGSMLRRLVRSVPDHLAPGGEAWLVLSDLAELLGLRTPDALPELVEGAGLTVLDRLDAPPRRTRPPRPGDPLAPFRARERVSLWRLACRPDPAGQP